MNNSVSERLDVWYKQEPGKSLALAEQQAMAETLHRLFGYYLLQIGGSNVVDLVSASPVLNKVRLDHEVSAVFRGLAVQGQPPVLPFLPKSFDIILLPHTLEFTEKPVELLHEAHELLIPGGHLIILGFNPFSLWGIMRGWRNKELAFTTKLIRFGQLHHWLNHFGLRVESYNALFFRPPFRRVNRLQRTLFLEGVTKRRME